MTTRQNCEYRRGSNEMNLAAVLAPHVTNGGDDLEGGIRNVHGRQLHEDLLDGTRLINGLSGSFHIVEYLVLRRTLASIWHGCRQSCAENVLASMRSGI
ncbi:hypothetical protein AVEN_37382-1 [Araneus ventricosus]|uniref:Uncharacterized protein n=1 Tax=Araneus ventricosus TaxID=182803 RepID=A0A4Y2LJ20_ARAVE|nr:hypothetical protein AVEN_37382-1 [Araneus ventricosus]